MTNGQTDHKGVKAKAKMSFPVKAGHFMRRNICFLKIGILCIHILKDVRNKGRFANPMWRHQQSHERKTFFSTNWSDLFLFLAQTGQMEQIPWKIYSAGTLEP